MKGNSCGSITLAGKALQGWIWLNKRFTQHSNRVSYIVVSLYVFIYMHLQGYIGHYNYAHNIYYV